MTWQEAYSVKHLTVSTNNDLTPVNSEKCNIFFTRWKLTKSIIPNILNVFWLKESEGFQKIVLLMTYFMLTFYFLECTMLDMVTDCSLKETISLHSIPICSLLKSTKSILWSAVCKKAHTTFLLFNISL